VEEYNQASIKLEKKFCTDLINGLSEKEAKIRLQTDGSNSIHTIKNPSLFSLFVDQLRSALMLFLIGAALVIYFFDELFDACMTLAIVLVNAFLGAYQEYKIARVMHGIEKAKTADVWVMRDGVRQIISVTELVRGDIVFVATGEKIPADGIVVESYDCVVDESMITGESILVNKYRCKNISGNDSDSCVVQSGSFVVSGYVKMVVSATGPRTGVGKAHAFVQSLQEAPILEDELRPLLRMVFLFVVGACSVFVAFGLFLHKPFGQLFSTVIALFMCIVPQGLPIIMTLVLASSAYAMKKKGLLAKRLHALVTLGRINCIVFDKTGTITLNQQVIVCARVDGKMYLVTGSGYESEGIVTENGHQIVYEKSSEHMRMIAIAGVLLDYATIIADSETGHAFVKGDPFLAALTVFSKKLKINKQEIRAQYKELYVIPYLEERGYRVSFFESDTHILVMAVGKASNIMTHAEGVPLADYTVLDTLTNEGLRVSSIATKVIDKERFQEKLNSIAIDKQSSFWKSLAVGQLVYHGMVATADPVRQDAKQVIDRFKALGVSVVMATGDVAEIAQSVAAHVGIFSPGDYAAQGVVLLTDSVQDYKKTSVWSRMTPFDKVTLVERLQKQGLIVAMVGDGANDAPALKVAHVGIVMGKGGSESAKIAAPLILTNDQLSIVADALFEARHCMDAFKRIMIYFFTTNCAEMMIIFTAFFVQSELSLLAPHILWLNIVSDGFLDTSLAFEPYDLEKSPAIVNVMHRSVIWFVLYQALLIAAFSFTAFCFYKTTYGIEKARTMTLVMITMCQWAVAINCRSLTRSIFKKGFFSNAILSVVLLLIPVCLIAIVSVPLLRFVFKMMPLNIFDWLLVSLAAIVLLAIEEVRKMLAY